MLHTKKIILILISFALIPLISNYVITQNSKNKLFETLDSIPVNKTGLLLGANKFTKNGGLNLYYKYRVEAALKLYHSGKIEFVLISGDNSSKNYDEPSTFKKDLIMNGIPEEKIYLDYAGFRTLDSVIRAKEIFGQNSITIISQKFHNERAIFIANHHNIEVIGFNAKDVEGRYGFKTKFREYLAKTKAILDLIINVKPKFLGSKIIIE